MARTVTRPHIVVQAVYMGGGDMQEMFLSLLVNEVRKGKVSKHKRQCSHNTQRNTVFLWWRYM